MPWCQGRPEGDCPDRKNDSSVRSTQGDLFLCTACDEYRFPTCDEVRQVRNKPQANRGTAGSVSGGSVPGTGAGKRRDDNAAIQRSTVSSRDNHDDGGAGIKLIRNELLSYVHFYRDCSNNEALRYTIRGFCSAEDISEAKKLLLSEFQPKLMNCPYMVECRNSTARLASEAEVEDILGILDAADMQLMLGSCCFVAAKLDMLPKYGPKELNLAAVVDKQVKMETAVDNISARVEKNDSSTATLASRLDSFSAAMTAQIEKLTNICSELSSSAHCRGSGSRLLLTLTGQ